MPSRTTPSSIEATIQPEEDPVDRLIERATDLFERGEAVFKEEDIQEARPYFQQSLQTLKNSGFDFFLNPQLESAYYGLLGKIQELELQALVDPSEMQLPRPESTPLDEIADLNLFTIKVDPQLEKLLSQELFETRFDIPVVLNANVVRFLNYYQTRGRKIMEEGLKRSGKYLPLFREIFRKEGIPLDLVYMAHVESLFKPHAYSRARAKGLWQFTRGTARLYGLRQDWWIDERSHIIKSTEAAARHLEDLYGLFQDWNLAMAAYNVGAQRIQRIIRRYGPMDYWRMAKRRLLPRETRNFVPSILASIIIFRHPERYGFYIKPDDAVKFETVALEDQVDLRVAAEALDVSLAELFELNPELRRGVTPFDYEDYQLKVPMGRGELLKERLASLAPEKKVRFNHHKVKRGETLSVIAQGYSSSIQAIAQMNRIRNIHWLREGQDLIIPLSVSGFSFSAASRSRFNRELPTSYIVRRGDSLARIARMYGVSLKDLLLWNNLKADQIIYPGQRIRTVARAESVVGSSSANTGTVGGK
ncbi:LysM peptidoglycan-binding domain-containing protein [Acidobacteria bacterium AH-259-L09]|nr:LysM peptidoglycan-binding domain-containing protein [Acidobacteria bacterium AH-259-L09]